MKNPKKLVWQVYPSYILLILLTLLATSLYVSHSVKRFYLHKVEQQLETHARYFSTLLPEDPAFVPEAQMDKLCKRLGSQLATRFTVILPTGQVIGDTRETPAEMDNHANRPEIRTALSGSTGRATRFSATLQQNMVYVALPRYTNHSLTAVVRASVALSSVNLTLQEIYSEMILIGIIFISLAAAVSLFVAHRINQPLEHIRRGAMRFAYGDLTHRIHTFASHEIEILTETLNQMALQLHGRIQAISRERSELEAVLTSMVEAVVIVDKDERIVRCNQAAGRIFGFTAEAVTHRNIQEVIRNASIQRFVRRTFEADEPVVDVVALNTYEKEQFLHAYSTQIYETDDQKTIALLVFHDVTRLKQLENIRREFVANVSHELKTPITSIEGFIETLQEGAINDPATTAKFLAIIERNAHRLNAIIDDLLTLSKIEQEEDGKQILLTPGKVRDVLTQAVGICQTMAQENQVIIELVCPPNLWASINADLLVQAVVNLLDNAVKYSEPGSSVRVQAKRAETNVAISVEDTGIGIAPEHLPRLFERFYRVDKARSRKIGGTGLGLAIVKHIANAHHGRATVASLPGEGSTFSIILPVW